MWCSMYLTNSYSIEIKRVVIMGTVLQSMESMDNIHWICWTRKKIHSNGNYNISVSS